MSATELIATHILSQYDPLHKPLFVALQGPQGSGKSFLSANVQETLSSSPHSLRVVVLSIDDLYLTHDDLVSLARSHPLNPLWQGRGQPGTHDVALGVRILSALKEGVSDVEIPRFDKSLFAGEGDRLPMDGTGTVVKQPPQVDVVILEGWLVGFYPVSSEELDRRWDTIWKDERERLALGEEQTARKVDVQDVNAKLRGYVPLWSVFDIFVQIRPAPSPPSMTPVSRYAVVYKWRLQQEHHMKALNGGRGMSDEAVKSFVDRYIPGYVFFGVSDPNGFDDEGQVPRWKGKGLAIVVDEGRKVIGNAIF